VRLAVDASTLVAEVLRARGRRLIADPALDLVVAADAWDETRHELHKRVTHLVARGHLAAEPAADLLQAALAAVAAAATVVPREGYANRLEEARRRIPRDPQDAPTVALALAADCGIWTADHDFFGCGLPVWTTETLEQQLASSR
jgi:predicted nucleic acid-binding protein